MFTIGERRAQKAQQAFAAHVPGWYVRALYTKIVFEGPFPSREAALSRNRYQGAYELVERELLPGTLNEG